MKEIGKMVKKKEKEYTTYEGDIKNGKKEGKGIYYFNNGDREMGDYLNDNKIGKHVKLLYNGIVESCKY